MVKGSIAFIFCILLSFSVHNFQYLIVSYTEPVSSYVTFSIWLDRKSTETYWNLQLLSINIHRKLNMFFSKGRLIHNNGLNLTYFQTQSRTKHYRTNQSNNASHTQKKHINPSRRYTAILEWDFDNNTPLFKQFSWRAISNVDVMRSILKSHRKQHWKVYG